jgi:hypothetical protein
MDVMGYERHCIVISADQPRCKCMRATIGWPRAMMIDFVVDT